MDATRLIHFGKNIGWGMPDEVSVSCLESFKLTRVLREDPLEGSIVLLGSLQHAGSMQPAIVSIQRAAFDPQEASALAQSFARLQALGNNDVYNWYLGWFAANNEQPHAKVNIIVPASETHIKKYTEQAARLVRETPELYRKVVEPYIKSFPLSRIQWVYNILDHITETERIIYEDPDPTTGFLIVPDLKWDQKTLSALYVQVIVHNRAIRSIRDLRSTHLPLLRSIDERGRAAVAERYGVRPDEIRAFCHYQPSYYHLHVHMLHVGLRGYGGSTVGQSHLLADVINNLELDESSGGEPYYAGRTFTYAIGEQHGLYAGLTAGE